MKIFLKCVTFTVFVMNADCAWCHEFTRACVCVWIRWHNIFKMRFFMLDDYLHLSSLRDGTRYKLIQCLIRVDYYALRIISKYWRIFSVKFMLNVRDYGLETLSCHRGLSAGRVNLEMTTCSKQIAQFQFQGQHNMAIRSLRRSADAWHFAPCV